MYISGQSCSLGHHIVFVVLWLLSYTLNAQQLILMDANDGNRIVNDGVINVSTTDLNTLELSAHVKILNNTDRPLAVFMKKITHQQVDSTSNYFCLNPKCWPHTDSTNIADSIPAGAIDSSFITHYDHYFVYQRPIPPGLTSITYHFYDYTTFPEPIDARVTVNYLVSGVGLQDFLSPEVYLYPNPASEFAAFRYDLHSFCKNAHVSVCNMQGMEVGAVVLDGQSGKAIIPTLNLPSGLYFCTLHMDGKSIFTKKLVVRH